MSLVDCERDCNVVGNPLLPWGARGRYSNGELDYDRGTDDSEVDHTRRGGGKRTTGAGGISVIIVGDEETNANLGDGVRDCDGARDDG